MSVTVEDIALSGKMILFGKLIERIEPLTSIIILDTALESMRAAFQQSSPSSLDDRPNKRRKTAKGRSRSLIEENGMSPAGIPLGYIPLARLKLRIVSRD